MKTAWLAAALGIAGAVWAQAPDDVVDPVNGSTVEELAARAVAENGDLLAGRQEVAAAQGGLLQAGLRANPMVQTSGMKAANSPMNSFMLGASLPLELFQRKERRVEVARGEVTVSEFEQADRERRLRAMVESKFGDVLAARRDLSFTVDLLALNRQALELTQARADSGAAPRLDADLLRVEVNRIDAMRAEFEAKVGAALLALKSLVGLMPGEDLRLKGSLETPPLTIAQEEALRRALATRPDLLALRAAEGVGSSKVKQAETEGKLDASVSATYQRSDNGFMQRGFNTAGQLTRVQGIFQTLTLGVAMTLPVRDRNQGAVAAAAAEVEGARRRREYAELVIAQEVASAFLVQGKARESLDIYGRGVRDQAVQNLAVIRRTYELGRNQLLDVIAEQRRLIDVETGYTEALNRYYQSCVAVRAAANLE